MSGRSLARAVGLSMKEMRMSPGKGLYGVTSCRGREFE